MNAIKTYMLCCLIITVASAGVATAFIVKIRSGIAQCEVNMPATERCVVDFVRIPKGN